MLVVHPSSTCDVCLEGYTGDSETIPYSISCGHTFCLSCLQSLRQHSCPLCRCSFELSSIRRLHVDRNGQPSTVSSSPQTPSLRSPASQELDENNALGLYDRSPKARQLQNRITDLVLESSFTSGVRESGVRELIQEIHAFLHSEPPERHSSLRAPFFLLYRFTELQAKYQQTESANFNLRSENNREKQAVLDWERKYHDLQRSRTHDQDTAKNVEASLRQRLHIEEREWQRKYDSVVEQLNKLREEFDKLRFSPERRNRVPSPSPTRSSSQLYFLTLDEKQAYKEKGDEAKVLISGKDLEFSLSSLPSDSKDGILNSNMFHISPVPKSISLDENRCAVEDGVGFEKSAKTSPVISSLPPYNDNADRSRSNSISSNISRASDSAAHRAYASQSLPTSKISNRQRSDSNPHRSPSRESLKWSKEKEPEVSSSAPSSYGSPLRVLFASATQANDATIAPIAGSSDQPTPEVVRLYSLLERPVPKDILRSQEASGSSAKGQGDRSEISVSSRPALTRSTSLHQTCAYTHSSNAPLPNTSSACAMNLSPISLTSSHIRAYGLRQAQAEQQPSIQPTSQGHAHAQTQTQAQIRTPPRPNMLHMHSLYSPSRKPVPPQESRVGSNTAIPRRGSLSSASAAAALQVGPQATGAAPLHARRGVVSTGAVTALVPPSSLNLGKPHVGGLWENQDSD